MIHRTVERLEAVSPPLPPAVVDEVDRQLADLARGRSPQQLADAAHEVLLRLDPDGEVPHDTDRPVEELRTHTGRDGSFSGRFRFAEPETAELIRSAIESRTPAPDPDADTTPLRPGRSLDARRGEALRLLAHDAGPTDTHPDVAHDPTADPAADQPAEKGQDADEKSDSAATAGPTDTGTGTGVAAEASRPARDRPTREPRSSSPSTSTPSPSTAQGPRPRRGAGRASGCSTASTR